LLVPRSPADAWCFISAAPCLLASWDFQLLEGLLVRVLSRRFLLVMSLLAGALVLAVAGASAPAASPPGGAKRTTAGPSAKVVSERVAARTATSRTYLLSDGTRRTRIWTSPVNYRKADGQWAAIDTTLKPDGADALRTTAAGVPVELPRTLDAPVQVTDPAGRSVAFRLRGADAGQAAKVDGSTATYADVRPGVDATYEARATGVKETLTLADASAPASLSFALDPSTGLTPSLRPDGSVQFRDAKGAPRFVIPAPTVQPAGASAPSTAHVAYRLSDGGATLTVAVDPEWLAQARFPVKVDPSLLDFDSDACTLSNGSLASTPDCGDTYVRVGNDASHVQRAAIRFGTLESQGIPATAVVSYAQLYLTTKALSNTASSERIDVSALGKQLAPGATWATYDGIDPWDTPGGDADPAAAPVTSQYIGAGNVGYDIGFDVTSVVTSWVRSQDVNGSNASTNNGLLLRAHDEAPTELVTFGGPAYPAQNSVPALEVDWEAHMGAESDQTYESVGIDDHSGLKVNVVSGNLAVQSNDIHIPGVDGLDLNVSRTYNSENVGDQHLLGSAWTESINGAALRMRFNGASHSHVMYANGGAVYRFNNADANIDSIGAPNLQAPAGIDGKMAESSTTNGVTVTFPDGTVWTYTTDYDGWQELQQIKDAHGNHIDLAYSDNDDAKSLTSITDSYNHVLTVNRDANGVVTGLTDATGRHWSYGLGGSYHNLDSFTNPDSKTTSYTYDTSHPWDIWDWISRITDARGHAIDIGYSGATGDWQQVTSITRVVDGGANDVEWQFDYDPAGGFGHSCSDTTNQRTVETDPRGKLTTYCYDTQGHVVETWDALSRKAKAGYDAQGNVISAASAAGGTGNPLSLSYASDANHNLTGGQEPAGETFGLTYCKDAGSPANACTGGVTGSIAEHRVQQSRDEQGTKSNFDYNATGDLTSVRANASPTVAGLVLAYNTSGSITDGTLASSTDGNGNTTSYGYTSHNLTSITPPSSSTLIGATTMTYDSENRLKTVTDGLLTTATLTYDGEDRVTGVSFSSGKSFTITYDGNGNPTQRVEKNGATTVNTTTYGYDNLNRRTSEAFPGSLTNGYGYDKIGNLVSAADPFGTTTYSYDDINRLTAILSPKLGSANCATTPASCDAIAYAYADLAGAAATANGGATSRQTVTFPGSTLSQVLQANASGNVTSTAVKNHAGTVLQGFSYAYKPSGGNQQSLVSSLTQQPASLTTTYGYDTANAQTTGALVSAVTKNSGGTTTDSWAYTYDKSGNRKTRVHGATTTTYAYNVVNELCWAYTGASANACGTTPTGATTYAFDRDGDGTTGGLAYDALHRMTTAGSSAVSYLTPGEQELVGYGSNAYHNGLLGLDREIVSGVTTGYTRQPDGTPVAQRSGTTKQYLVGDRLGSVTALADDNADSLTRTYAYDPDGNRTSTGTGTGSGAVTDLGFAGGHLLPNSMYHYGARFYDPSLARWTQQDPLNPVASQQDANRYAYLGGNPVNGVDPAGLCIVDAVCDAADNVSRGASRVAHATVGAAKTVARGAKVAANDKYVRYGAETVAVGGAEIACGPGCAVAAGTALWAAENPEDAE
jgi:RHS repeat-associated protein